MARGVDGGHARCDVGDGLVLPVLEADVAVRRPYLPPCRAVVDGAVGVLDEVARGGGGEVLVCVLDPVEGLGEEEDLAVHVGLLPLYG